MTASDGSRSNASSDFGGQTLHGAGTRVDEPQSAGTPVTPAASAPPAHDGHWSSSSVVDDATSASAPSEATTSIPAVAAPTAAVPPVRPPVAPPRGPGGGGGRPPRPKKSSRGPRRARLQLRGISVWSALRFSVVLSIAMFCVWMVMVGVLYGILDGVGAISKVNEAIVRIDPSSTAETVTPSMVFGGGVVIGAVYMVLFIAISTVGTLIYNLCADLVGGVELTLSERE
ncbi:MAG: uncharacterized protein JWN61_550 [Pseudonocardiales bacterium]|nr:uncharacterized protein [Pseudonocardiales bacterium]